jgi:hypothetical protein
MKRMILAVAVLGLACGCESPGRPPRWEVGAQVSVESHANPAYPVKVTVEIKRPVK